MCLFGSSYLDDPQTPQNRFHRNCQRNTLKTFDSMRLSERSTDPKFKLTNDRPSPFFSQVWQHITPTERRPSNSMAFHNTVSRGLQKKILKQNMLDF